MRDLFGVMPGDIIQMVTDAAVTIEIIIFPKTKMFPEGEGLGEIFNCISI